MINFKDLLKKQNQNQLILIVVLLVYVLFDTPIPHFLKPFFNNVFGQLSVILVALILLMYFNPILGVLGIFVAFLMLKKSYSQQAIVSQPIVTEEEKTDQMSDMNRKLRQSDETLEIETVGNMTPFVSNLNFTDSSYKPVLEDKIKGSTI